MAFISPYEWESKGTIYLMKIVSGEIEQISLNIKVDLTPKYLFWNKNDSLLLLLGPLYGTIEVGGDLYSYDINNNELKLLKEFEKKFKLKKFIQLMKVFYV